MTQVLLFLWVGRQAPAFCEDTLLSSINTDYFLPFLVGNNDTGARVSCIESSSGREGRLAQRGQALRGKPHAADMSFWGRRVWSKGAGSSMRLLSLLLVCSMKTSFSLRFQMKRIRLSLSAGQLSQLSCSGGQGSVLSQEQDSI